jgi:uncharacterized protein YycO
MEIWFFKGKSLISRVIQFFTWSKYSHVGIKFSNNEFLEIWPSKEGVTLCDLNYIHMTHQKGTVIDIFTLDGKYINENIGELENKIYESCKKYIGSKYDFLGILGFVFRKKVHKKSKWFCSELVHHLFSEQNIRLVNTDSCKVHPGLLSYSPLLKKVGTIKLVDNKEMLENIYVE